jgi:MFS family permease
MNVLLFSVLIMHLATYMVLPLIPIFLKVQKGMSVTEIGLILAVSPFTFQAGSILGGFLADRIGRRSVIAIGAWINAIALVGYGIFNQLSFFIGVALLSGLGVGLNAPAIKAAIAALASQDENKTTAFSLRGIAANIGTSIAGLLTFFVLGGSSSLIFYVAAGLFIFLGAMSWLLLPKGCGDEPCQVVPLKSYREIFRNKAFLGFSLISVLIWALYTQLSLSLPLRAEDILPDPSIVSLIWTINSITVIFLQTPVSRWIIEKINPMYTLSIGVLFIGGGLTSIYWSTSFYWLVLSGVIFIIGEMLVVPTMDGAVSQLGTAKMIGVFFGIANFISGMGEGIGKYTGGQLLSNGTASIVPWFTYAIAAVIISGMLVAIRFWKPIRNVFEGQTMAHASAGTWTDDGKSSSEHGPTSVTGWILGRKKRAK